jgi:hypothetical protein
MQASHLIFADPPSDIDETWVHGAMLGGMVGYDDESLAPSYFASASLLIHGVLDSATRAQDAICPILYLYRHGIELYLKVLVQPAKLDHSISSLFDAFCRDVKQQFDEDVPMWLSLPVSQFAEFDPNSDLFRYGQTRNPAVAQKMTNSGEFWVDLRSLRRTMMLVERVFQRVLVAQREGLEGLKRLQPPTP